MIALDNGFERKYFSYNGLEVGFVQNLKKYLSYIGNPNN